MSDRTIPWDQHPSIYEHLLAHARPDGPGLTDGGERLPDDERVDGGHRVRFAPGAADGIHTHHMASGNDEESADRLLDAVRAYADAPTVANKLVVYELLAGARVIALIDPFMERLAALQEDEAGTGAAAGLNWARVYELARSFATESPDREPVKWGIAVLAPFGRPEDLDLLLTLGRHDEFTLYCVVAVGGRDDAVDRLWELARNAEGWGRVHAVERLAAAAEAETLPDEVRDWLLREGYRNAVMYEYLAHPCATAGGLRDAVTRPSVDDELLTAAGEILDALFAGGPGPDVDAYEDAAAAADAYLGHVRRRPDPPLAAFRTARTIDQYVRDPSADWAARAAAGGWTPAVRASVAAHCSAILGRSDWPARVADGLRSGDERVFADADAVADVLGIDTWDVHWSRLLSSPLDGGHWYHVMRRCDAARIGDVLALAERTIPLDRIATGPGDELGMGPAFAPHGCLDFVLQELGRFPGRGGTALVTAALRSPVTRNRNLAAKVLADWGEPHWPAGVREALAAARDREPDGQVRRRFDNVLAGRPIEDGLGNDDGADAAPD